MFKKLIIYAIGSILLSPTYLQSAPANTVVATINVGVTPAGIAITPDSRFAYVANNNNYDISLGSNNADSVTVLDLTTNLPVTTIYHPSFMQPYTITLNAAGTKAYVTNSTGSTISIIDTASNTVTGTITGFDGPSDMAITPDGNFAYVSNYGATPGVGSGNATTVNYVNLNTNTIVGSSIQVGLAPNALAISPDGAFVYVIDYDYGMPNDGSISIIRTSDNSVTLNAIPGLFGPFDIVLSADGNYAYVTNFGSNNFEPYGTTVSVVDLSSRTIIATTTLGIQPAGIALTPDGRFAYATNYNTLYASNYPQLGDLTAGQGTVNIIDLTTNTVIPPTISVDQSPANIAISPNGQFAYVSNFTSNTVNVIALQSFQITAQGCRTRNIFLSRTDFINKLTWTVTGPSLPVSYSIYRDAALTNLAGTVSASQPAVFYDHNTNPNATYTYYIVGTNAVGTTSAPVPVTVTQNC